MFQRLSSRQSYLGDPALIGAVWILAGVSPSQNPHGNGGRLSADIGDVGHAATNDSLSEEGILIGKHRRVCNGLKPRHCSAAFMDHAGGIHQHLRIQNDSVCR
jgi:hypothetical protein